MGGGVISFWVDATDLPQVVDAGHPLPVVLSTTTTLTAKGYQQIVALAAAAPLTVPSGSTQATIMCESQPVRWRDDGVAPTASVGMELLVGQVMIYNGPLAALQFIQEAASAKLNVSYYA